MKKLLVLLVIVGGGLGYLFTTTPLLKITELDSRAFNAYKTMFFKVLETGDPAKGMIMTFKVDEEVTSEEVVESIYSLANEHNMRITDDLKMFTNEANKGKADKVYSARNISLCSLSTAKKFLDFSIEFGGFMPCRIMLITMGDGTRILQTMSLDMMIHGGKPLPPEMYELASAVQKAMVDIPEKAAQGDF